LDLSDAFVNVAETVTPAVVRIEARKQVASRRNQNANPFSNPFFRRDENPEPRPDQVAGGSGFIVSDDGYILTNNHVVTDATSLTVFLQDRRSFPATLVGQDPFTDVAVIKIEGNNLTKLHFGDSEQLRVGEWIVAIGNPGFGGTSSPLDYTVTVGIVSAIGRPLQLLQRELAQDEETANNRGFAIEDFIQTDAVINPGNSGGPMVNLKGQVVGINSAIASRTGFYQGYGFAIPIDLARRVMEDLVDYGAVRRAWLGVAMRPIDALSAESYGLPSVSGVELTTITGDSPAEEYGLQPYDVITEVDDVPIGRVGQLQQNIAMKRPGDAINVKIYRENRPMDVSVVLGEAPLQPRTETAASTGPVREERMDDKLGLAIEDMNTESASVFGYEDASGALISRVEVNGPAARRGVTPGWKVIEINRQPISDAEDAYAVLQGLNQGEIVTLHLSAPTDARQIVHIRVPE
jgi:serine protease Do